MTEVLMNAEAQSKLIEVEALVSKLAEAEKQLEAGYAQLGLLLEDVVKYRYWIGSYESFGEFMMHLSTKYNVGRAQLYNYRTTATALLGAGITPDEMNTMGINKARVLADAAKHEGHIPSKMIEAALQPQATTKDIRKILFETFNRPPDENNDWFDLGFEFYATEEQRETFNDAANAARHGDPAIPEGIADSMQRLQIALKWAQNYLATYSKDVVEGGRGL